MKTRRELIVKVIETVKNDYLNDKLEINLQLSNSLRKKYEKCGKDEEKYIELLKFNIIYFKSIIKKLEAILELWIHNDIISSPASVRKSVENITASSKKYVNTAIKDGYDNLNDRDKNIYHSYDNSVGYKKLEKIENDYRILSLYKDVLNMALGTIASNADEYKFLLEMGIEEVRVDLMMEIFSMIDEVLFTEIADAEEDNQALLDEDTDGEVGDYDKTKSFLKYVSMVSAPEISVKLNDLCRSILMEEDIDDEGDYYGFTDDCRDYASSLVLLLDYVNGSEKMYFVNALKLFVNGEIDQELFIEVVEKLIRDHTFLASVSWKEAQKLVKSDFNLEKNSFFKKLIAPKDPDLTLPEVMDVVIGFDGEGSIIDFDGKSYRAKEDSMSGKLKNTFHSFTERMKIKKNEDAYDSFSEEDYDDEYEEDKYVADYDEEDYEPEESKFSFKKLGKIFKSEPSDDEEDYEEESPSYKNIPVSEEKFKGDTAIQDENAVAMLKLREASKQLEEETKEREHRRLLNEKKLAEEIKKNGKISNIESDYLVTSDDDFVYKKDGSENAGYDNVKSSGISDNVNAGRNTEGASSTKDSKPNHPSNTNPSNMGHSKGVVHDSKSDANSEGVHTKSENRIERVAKIPASEFSKDVQAESGSKMPKPETVKDNAKEFAELEFLKSMKEGDKLDIDRIKHYSNVDKTDKPKVDLSSLGKRSNQDDDTLRNVDTLVMEPVDDEEDYDDYEFEGKKFRMPKVSIPKISIPKMSGRGKLARDLVIILVLMAIVAFGYIYVIRSFRMPSVGDTNKLTQQQEIEKNKNKANGTNKPANNSKNTTTAKEEKKPVDSEQQKADEQASALDREAENYKGSKSRYYTVYVGASKSEDGMQETADNFKSRGVDAVLIRNAGYYMLKVGEYFNYNEAYAESQRISAKGIQNYVAGRNKYFDLKIEALKTRIPYMTKDQLNTDYNDLRNQIQATGKDQAYITNLDEIYNDAAKLKQ